MRHLRSLLFLLILLGCPGYSQAQQLWSGIISPSRATDWTQAGIPVVCQTAIGRSAVRRLLPIRGRPLQSAPEIQGCKANQYVLLGPGTFNLSTSIDFGSKSHVVLRGSGANSTFIVFTGSSPTHCNTGFSMSDWYMRGRSEQSGWQHPR